MSDLLSSFNKKSTNEAPLRQGKWTREEEEYVHCLIDEFKTGMMPLAEGTSLRTFLSKMLNCHPMRISKKFVGSNYNGKQVYTRRTGSDRLSNDQVKARRAKLCELERKFLAKIAPNKPKPPSQYQGGAGGQLSQLQQMAAAGRGGLDGAGLGGLGGAGGFGSALGGGGLGSTSGMDIRNLLNQGGRNFLSNQGGGSELSRNMSLLEMPLNDTFGGGGGGGSASNHSLSGLFQELVNNNSTGSLDAFNLMMSSQADATPSLGGSNHFGSSSKSGGGTNSRAAAAGRALLGRGGLGLDRKSSGGGASAGASSSSTANKPLSEFTSAELAAELRKRSSLQDLLGSLGAAAAANSAAGGSNEAKSSSSSSNTAAALRDSLQQAEEAKTSASAFSTLLRNSNTDMSNLIERQGSIDSLSNLAIRSRLQSIQSMGSLLDPFMDGSLGGAGAGGNSANRNWTAAAGSNLNLGNLAAKVSTESISNPHQRRTAATNNFMASLNSFNALNTAGSGLNLASLLNNEDALRRLESTAPSSLNQNFSFRNNSSNKPDPTGGNEDESDHRRSSSSSKDRVSAAAAAAAAAAASGEDDNTAIAQFLLQKKLLEQQAGSSGIGGVGDSDKSGKPKSASEQQQLMMNIAAGGGAGSSSSSGMDPTMMSSLLGSLKSSNNDLGAASGSSFQQDDFETLKRKFLSGGSAEGLLELEQQRRNKPFR